MPKVSDMRKPRTLGHNASMDEGRSAVRGKLLIVCGPTATGKTKLAVELAKRFDGELVSVDSRQVYRGLDVISGKDTDDLAGIPLHLIDVATVGEQFNVSSYRKLALAAIEDIYSRGKLPILVGGTGLYIESVTDKHDTYHIPPDETSRARWDALTVQALQQELDHIAPDKLSTMNASDRYNPRRLIRALEVAAWQQSHKGKVMQASVFDACWIGLTGDTVALEKRITDRVDDRWNHGALTEAKRFPDAVATGMRPISRYLQGKASEQEARALWVREEVSYAKRQMTWFKRNPSIHWYQADERNLYHEVEKRVAAWYT